MTTIAAILLVISGLQIKHFLADFALQNQYILRHRRDYGHPGGLLHALIHGLGTGLVFVLAGASVGWVLALMTLDCVIHYHIDWAKDNLCVHRGWTAQDNSFWLLMGVDQLLHQLTYLALIWLYVAAIVVA